MQVKNEKNERVSIRNKMREKLAMKDEEERKKEKKQPTCIKSEKSILVN